jgi:hypothetical protein
MLVNTPLGSLLIVNASGMSYGAEVPRDRCRSQRSEQAGGNDQHGQHDGGDDEHIAETPRLRVQLVCSLVRNLHCLAQDRSSLAYRFLPRVVDVQD